MKPSTEPFISVVMATFNGEAYIESMIRSILDQSHSNLELIIADDRSTDHSFDIATRIASQDQRIKLYRNNINLGIVKNFRQSLSLAQGDLICFSDQDDVWRKDKLRILAALLLKNKLNMLAYSDLEICDSQLKTIFRSFWKASSIKPRCGKLRELAFLRNIIPGCSMMFRRKVRDVLLRIPWDCSFMHDHLAFIVSAAIGKIVFSREPLMKYRQHPQNCMGAFYPSVMDRKRFYNQLKKEICFLKDNLPIDCSRIQRFAAERLHKSALGRMRFLDYYLFLRKDTMFDKAMGVFECLFPQSYEKIRASKHKD